MSESGLLCYRFWLVDPSDQMRVGRLEHQGYVKTYRTKLLSEPALLAQFESQHKVRFCFFWGFWGAWHGTCRRRTTQVLEDLGRTGKSGRERGACARSGIGGITDHR